MRVHVCWNGMTLSVLSILARRGMDPWQEAERLAKLPRTEAVDGLAQIIATTPASRWSLLDAKAIASRLVALLPAPGAGPYNASSAQPATKPTMTSGRILVLALAALLFGLTLNLFSRPEWHRRIVPRLPPRQWPSRAAQNRRNGMVGEVRLVAVSFQFAHRRHVCDRQARGSTKAKDDRESGPSAVSWFY